MHVYRGSARLLLQQLSLDSEKSGIEWGLVWAHLLSFFISSVIKCCSLLLCINQIH